MAGFEYAFKLLGPSIHGFQFRSAVIGSTSGFDAFLAYYYRRQILELEQNPICLALMHLEPANLSVFLIFKMIGTVSVLCILAFVFRLHQRVGNGVCNGLFWFQVGLIAYQLLR